MPEISFTDSVASPVEGVKIDWTSASSLFTYLRSELLHLIVAPDFLARKDLRLRQAAPEPLSFQLKIGNQFQLGKTKPEIDFTPGAQAALRVNAASGADLFEDDPFRAAATV